MPSGTCPPIKSPTDSTIEGEEVQSNPKTDSEDKADNSDESGGSRLIAGSTDSEEGVVSNFEAWDSDSDEDETDTSEENKAGEYGARRK